MATVDLRGASTRLLVRPSPLKGEGLRGYLLRVGECNGLGTASKVFRYITGKDYDICSVSSEDLENIAQSLALSFRQVELMSYRPIGGDAKGRRHFFRHDISSAHFRSKNIAICPSCLTNQNAINGLWDLGGINACPFHGSWLISSCPSCGQSIGWNRECVSRCRCGFDLGQAETKPAPAEVLMQAKLIYQMVMQDLPFFGNEEWDCPDWTGEISLNQLLSIIRYVTDVMSPSCPFEQDWHEDDVRTGQVRSAVLFSEIIKDWPNGLWSVLIRYSDFNDAELVVAAGKFKSRYSYILKGAQRHIGLKNDLPEIFINSLRNFLVKLRIRGYDRSRDLKIISFLNPSALKRTPKGWILRTKDATLPVDLEGEGGIYEKLWRQSYFV